MATTKQKTAARRNLAEARKARSTPAKSAPKKRSPGLRTADKNDLPDSAFAFQQERKDPQTWNAGTEPRPESEPSDVKMYTSELLEDDDGNMYVIQQQNVGPGVEVGSGEWPDPHTPPSTDESEPPSSRST